MKKIVPEAMTLEQLKRCLLQAMRMNAQHPNFVDHSEDDPEWEGQTWFDPDAQELFDTAMHELLRRSDGYLTIHFPDHIAIRIDGDEATLVHED